MANVKMIATIDIVAKVPESVNGIIPKGKEFEASKEWAKKLKKINNAIEAPKKEKKAVKPYSKKKIDIKSEDGVSE
jgi:glutaredoxin 2